MTYEYPVAVWRGSRLPLYDRFLTKPIGVGIGLGLSLCQAIIEGHGGSIRLASTAGQGAVYRIELPVTLAN